jgi:hypothetical protein
MFIYEKDTHQSQHSEFKSTKSQLAIRSIVAQGVLLT